MLKMDQTHFPVHVRAPMIAMMLFTFSQTLGTAGCNKDAAPSATEIAKSDPLLAGLDVSEPVSYETNQKPPESSPMPQRDPAVPPAKIAVALTAMQVRQNCNRVMGCAVGEELISYGESATGPIVDFLKKHPPNAHYWPKLVKILGQIGDKKAAPYLRTQVVTDDSAARSEILVALGRIRDESSRDILTRFAEGTDASITNRDRIAALFSLVILGSTQYKAKLANYVGLFATENQNPMDTVLALELTLELGMNECLPDFRAASKHTNVFVRSQAVINMTAMPDEANIPALIERVDDELPATRKTAISALQKVSKQEFTTKDDWMNWCTKTQCTRNRSAENER